MNIVPTINPSLNRIKHTVIEDHLQYTIKNNINIFGLKCKYEFTDWRLNDVDSPWDLYPSTVSDGDNGTQNFSSSNKMYLKQYLDKLLSKKEKITIVEIGVNRNSYNESSTSILLDNKRDCDIYVGIDIEDKTQLNNSSKNIFTIKNKSEKIEENLIKMKEFGVNKIDLLFIDGWHSLNQVYREWDYTSILSEDGIVGFHDTNGHTGPYFILQSIDTTIFDVYKYLSDVVDYGIGFAVRK
jgi:hypothetical protein